MKNIVSVPRAADLNGLILGGLLYRFFPFFKESLVPNTTTLVKYLRARLVLRVESNHKSLKPITPQSLSKVTTVL
jgi:hypothetical protein